MTGRWGDGRRCKTCGHRRRRVRYSYSTSSSLVERTRTVHSCPLSVDGGSVWRRADRVGPAATVLSPKMEGCGVEGCRAGLDRLVRSKSSAVHLPRGRQASRRESTALLNADGDNDPKLTGGLTRPSQTGRLTVISDFSSARIWRYFFSRSLFGFIPFGFSWI